jgi:hypothetical protein
MTIVVSDRNLKAFYAACRTAGVNYYMTGNAAVGHNEYNLVGDLDYVRQIVARFQKKG